MFHQAIHGSDLHSLLCSAPVNDSHTTAHPIKMENQQKQFPILFFAARKDFLQYAFAEQRLSLI
ncbi:hypothetical protein, partial [Escherichia coli]|uniref:hypothetical protein n=1 Tax=Escherichia coli TaxID=562 RepID=UPI0032B5527B